jgi:hypothetical protein
VTRAFAVVAAIALALAMSCRIPDEHLRVGDGGSDVDASDGDAPPPACNLTAPWGPLVPVQGLEVLKSVARLSADETTAYFALGSDGAGSDPATLFVATRADLGSTFAPAVELSGVNGSDGESTPALAPDGKTLYYVWGEPPVHMTGSDRDIYRATRDGSLSQFGSAGKVGSINVVGAEDDYPFVAADGSLWFSSQRGSDTVLSIYFAPSVGGDQFSGVQRATELNSTTRGNYYPLLSADLLTIYFQRGGLLYTAMRGSGGASFEVPTTIDELDDNDCADTANVYCRPSWLSPDGCRLYIGTGSAGGAIAMSVSSKPMN